jgi:acetyl-CoA carboxylase biotin carboxyl carrier protein
MILSQDDIIQILKIMNESSFDELHLKMGDLELAINKHGCAARLESQGFASKDTSGSLTTEKTAIEAAADNPAPANLAPAAKTQEIKQKIESEISELGLIPIKSPMLGVFFRAPEPGAPPFVAAGSVVEDDTTVCTIEVMKLFSTIKAGVHGRIKRIYAEDGELVEHGQVLFLVDQDAD